MKSKPMILVAAAIKTLSLFAIGAGSVALVDMVQNKEALTVLLTIGALSTGIIYLVEVSGALDGPKTSRQLYDVYDQEDRVYTYLVSSKEEAAKMFLEKNPWSEIVKIERGAEL